MTLRFGSVCSGIEAISVGWRGLPFEAQWFAEIAPFPSAVLAARWPNVPNVGDFTRIDNGAGSIDLLGGGTPCQDFSVAGLRAGLAGERGNLTLEFVRLVGRTRPRWVLWENVPGVLSSDGGRALGAFLGGLGQLGYGTAYRVLDAQFFGVPQRRRRVFVVGYLGDWRRAAAVLFERDCLSWDPPPSRKAGTGVAAAIGTQSSGGRGWRLGADEAAGGQVVSALSASGIGVSGPDDNQGKAGRLIADTSPTLDASYGRLYGHDNQHIDAGGGLFIAQGPEVSPPALKARDRKGPSSDGDGDGAPLIAHTLRGEGFDASEDGTGRGTPIVAAYRTASGAGNTYETGDRVDALTTATDPNSHVLLETLQRKGYIAEHASPQEAHAGEVLRALRQAIGEEAFAQWGLGILDSLRSPTVLRSGLLGEGANRAEEGRGEVDDGASSRAPHLPGGQLRDVREAGRERRAPQEWRLAGQLARELGTHLSWLSLEGTSDAARVSGLWQASEGLGILRQALSALREVGRPAQDEAQPAQPRSGVRRLTPREAERLQGFPDDYTLIPTKAAKKLEPEMMAYYRAVFPGATDDELRRLAKDGPRYEALGNSMATPVMRWIGKRILMVEGMR